MKQKYSTKYLLLISSLMIVTSMLPVIISNNGNLYLVGDYMSQQIPFIKESKRLLLSGQPFWSSNTFLGSNFLGTYSFYNYASPFYWPLFLIPESMLGIGLSITFAIKHIIAASTAHLYLKRYIKTEHLSFIGALIYAFSGFVMDSTYYFHFIDVIAVFPALLYLVDEVLEGRKKVTLSLMVLLNCMINYYFVVSTSVFFLMYLIFKVRFSNGKYCFKDALRCIIFYAVGGIASMFILLPSALSLLETSKATGIFSSTLLRGLGTIPQLIRILKGIFLPSEGILGSVTGFMYSSFNSNVAFLPFLGGVFLLIALRRKTDTWYFKLYKFLFVLTVIPFGNGIFSLFTNVSYTRWWYAFVLMGIIVSLRIIEEKFENTEVKKSAKTISIISFAVVGLPLVAKILCAYVLKNPIIALLEKFSSKLPDNAIKAVTEADFFASLTAKDFAYIATFIIMTVASYLPLFIYIKKGWIYQAKKVVPAVALICTFTYCAYFTNEAVICNPAENYNGADIATSQKTEYTHRTIHNNAFANYPCVVNQPGISTFISFKSHSTAQFCNLVGYENTLHLNSNKFFNTPAIQSVLSVKTIVDKGGTEQNAPYYTPFGFEYEYYLPIENAEYTTNTKENNKRIENMTVACYLDKETAQKLDGIVKPLDKEIDWKKDFKKEGAQNFLMTSSGFTAKSSGNRERLIFFSVPHDNGWKAYVNGKETEIYTVNGGLMGIVVPSGEIEIEFTFTTPGLKAGIIVSAITLTSLAAYAVVDKIKKSKKED